MSKRNTKRRKNWWEPKCNKESKTSLREHLGCTIGRPSTHYVLNRIFQMHVWGDDRRMRPDDGLGRRGGTKSIYYPIKKPESEDQAGVYVNTKVNFCLNPN